MQAQFTLAAECERGGKVGLTEIERLMTEGGEEHLSPRGQKAEGLCLFLKPQDGKRPQSNLISFKELKFANCSVLVARFVCLQV